MNADGKDLPASATQWFRAVAAGAVLLAFCMQPVLRFVDADRFLGGGAFVGAAFTGLVAAWNETKRLPAFVFGLSGIVMLLLGGWLLASTSTRAGSDAVANDRRCIAIQRDMLSAHRRIEDGPDVFQALGCRPQGTGVIRVKPTDRELKAGHPLPSGGYSSE